MERDFYDNRLEDPWNKNTSVVFQRSVSPKSDGVLAFLPERDFAIGGNDKNRV